MKLFFTRLSLKVQLLFCAILGVAFGILVVTWASLSMFEKEIDAQIVRAQEEHLRIFSELLVQKGSGFHIDGDKLFAGPVVLNGNFDVPDRILEITGANATIFMADTRISTTIRTTDGKRAVGTKLQGPAYDAIFTRGLPFRGKSPILGVTYLAAYDPIRDSSGKVIGALFVGVPEENYFASFRHLERILVLLGALTLVFIAGITFLYGLYAFAPLSKAAAAAAQIAAGDLTGNLSSDRGDEAGILLNALQKMIANLRLLVGQVRSSSIQLTSAANQIGATASVQLGSAAELNDSCALAIRAANDVAAIGEHVLVTMERVSKLLEEAVESANSGNSRLAEMDEAMHSLMRGAEAVSTRLAEISARTVKISQAVAVMTKVADQTNLLSLNAAIEAKKAGEAGRGFTVLSEEIARLADSSAAGTLEIEQMANEVQQSVAAGVDEMTHYGEKVDSSVQASAETGRQLSKIIRLVQQLRPQFSTVTDSMRAQNANGQQIVATIHGLTEGAYAASASVQNLNEAAEHLNAVVKGLRAEVGKFKL